MVRVSWKSVASIITRQFFFSSSQLLSMFPHGSFTWFNDFLDFTYYHKAILCNLASGLVCKKSSFSTYFFYIYMIILFLFLTVCCARLCKSVVLSETHWPRPRLRPWSCQLKNVPVHHALPLLITFVPMIFVSSVLLHAIAPRLILQFNNLSSLCWRLQLLEASEI